MTAAWKDVRYNRGKASKFLTCFIGALVRRLGCLYPPNLSTRRELLGGVSFLPQVFNLT